MLRLEKFKQEELFKMNHYEVINYIANYVQYFYSVIMPYEKITFPISIQDILQKLDIKLKKVNAGFFVEKDSCFFSITSQGCYSSKDRTIYYYKGLENKYYFFNTILFKLLAYYIMEKNNHSMNYKNNFGILPFPMYDDMHQMLVSSLILPWKQAISMFLEDNMKDKIERRFSFYQGLISDSEYLMDLPSNYVEKLMKNYLQYKFGVSLNEVYCAYYQFNRILEAKRILNPKELENEEYKEFERVLVKYI